MKFIARSLVFISFIGIVLFQNTSTPGTADTASLTPSSAIILTDTLQSITFSATNDKAFVFKTYHAEFTFTAGLTIADIAATPPASKTTIDTRKNKIIFEWAAVSPGSTLTATFTVSSNVQGLFTISPTAVYYTDYSRKTYTASANSSTISVRNELVAPAAPRNVRSLSGNGSIVIYWGRPSDEDATRHNIYRRTSSTDFAKVAQVVGSPYSGGSYADGNVEDGKTYYYRVTAEDSSGNESEWYAETAETYVQLHVRSYDVPGVTMAAVGDVNGDGKPDLVIGDPSYTVGKGGNAKSSAGKVDIYYGGNTSGDPDVAILGENEYDQLGYALALVDMNSDGFDDLVVGTPHYRSSITGNPQVGKVSVFAGGTSFSTTPVYTREGDETSIEMLGFSVSPAGDVNNDGYPDVAVGAPEGGVKSGGYRSGRVQVLFGGSSLASPGSATAIGYGLYHLGCTVAAAGDVNGDGYDDIISGNTGGPIYSANSRASILYGGPYSLSFGFSVSSVISGSTAAKLLTSAGDINGDGYADFTIGRNIYFGGPSVDPVVDRILTETPDFISALGDVNRDGFRDLLASPGPRVFFSGTPVDEVPDFQYEGLNIIATGDVDRDGIQEAMVSADVNAVHVYSLASYVTGTLPDITILSPKNHLTTDASDIALHGVIRGSVTNLQIGGQYVPVQPDGTFAASVPLSEGTNIIEINAVSPTGRIAKRWLTIKKAQPTPLTLSITAPTDGTVYSYDVTIVVSGMVSNSTSTVLVNGVPANAYDNGYTNYFGIGDIWLAEGPNVITAFAQDDFGQTATSSVTLTLLTKGMLTGTVTNAVTALPLPGVTVTVQDSEGVIAATTDALGAYTVPGIAAGSYSATYTKVGFAKQTSSGVISKGQVQTIDVQMTPLPPLMVTITSPLDGEVLNASPVVVAGMVSNDATVTVNSVTATAGSGAFMASVPLNEGPNNITAEATDSYSQTASDTISVTLLTKGTITGSVSDSGGAGVASAKVTVIDSLSIVQTVYTDANGDYTMSNVNQGPYTLSMTQVDYSTYSDSGSIVAGETLMVNGTISLQSPVVSAVAPANISGCSATVSWTTDQPTSSVFEYGTTTAYGTVVTDPTFTTSHSVTLNGLTDSTTYHFNVTATNSHILSSSSGDGTFTTLGPPTISSVIVSNITTSSATIAWTTDQASDSVVTYGTTTAYGMNASDAALTTSHSIQLDNLGMQTPYHFTVSSADTCGHASPTADAVFTTEGPITITIVSPADNSTITRPDIIVKGTFTNTTGNETGIVVSGVLATVYGGTFVANHVPLTEGAGAITVTATDEEGYTASASINVTADTTANYISLITNIESGTPVLAPTLRIDGYDDSTTPDISYTGPGSPDWTECTSYEACKVQLTTEGIYYFTATGTGYDGNTYSDTMAITVLSSAEIDALLQAKWAGMKAALEVGNVDDAVTYFDSNSRERYRQLFSALTVPLSDMVQNMQSIQLINVSNDMAKYRIRKNELYGGQQLTITYYIYFTRNSLGLWELWKF